LFLLSQRAEECRNIVKEWFILHFFRYERMLTRRLILFPTEIAAHGAYVLPQRSTGTSW
jgi:hypothetical protein